MQFFKKTYSNKKHAQFSNLANYSTSEIKTGGRWTDGKPIYRKVINFGALPNADIKRVNHNIANLDKVINIGGYVKFPSGYYVGVQFVDVVGGFASSWYTTVGPTDVAIATGIDRSSLTAVVVLEYTKV